MGKPTGAHVSGNRGERADGVVDRRFPGAATRSRTEARLVLADVGAAAGGLHASAGVGVRAGARGGERSGRAAVTRRPSAPRPSSPQALVPPGTGTAAGLAACSPAPRSSCGCGADTPPTRTGSPHWHSRDRARHHPAQTDQSGTAAPFACTPRPCPSSRSDRARAPDTRRTRRRCASLPKALPAEHARTPNRDSIIRIAKSRRPTAVVRSQLANSLATCEVAKLRLADIDWRTGELIVRGKQDRHERLPLPTDVGDALVDYLRDGRPSCEDPHVFVKARAPFRPLTGGAGAIGMLVRTACERAGLEPVGVHSLRHTVATEEYHCGPGARGRQRRGDRGRVAAQLRADR